MELAANPDFRALATCHRLSELKADFERKLRDPDTGPGPTQYLRGVLHGIEKVLELPEREVKRIQRGAQEEAKRDFEGAEAGTFPTLSLRRHLPRFRAGGSQ